MSLRRVDRLLEEAVQEIKPAQMKPTAARIGGRAKHARTAKQLVLKDAVVPFGDEEDAGFVRDMVDAVKEGFKDAKGELVKTGLGIKNTVHNVKEGVKSAVRAAPSATVRAARNAPGGAVRAIKAAPKKAVQLVKNVGQGFGVGHGSPGGYSSQPHKKARKPRKPKQAGAPNPKQGSTAPPPQPPPPQQPPPPPPPPLPCPLPGQKRVRSASSSRRS